jgi:hypothetical protein
MNSGDLTGEHAEKLSERVGSMFGYLANLQQRMDARGFSPSDRLY